MTSRTPDEHPDTEPVAPARPASPDPEDWASTAGSSDDERYLRERPPHWE